MIYPSNWPATPFHPGELEIQDMFGVREHVNSYAPKFIRPFMPDQHREFYESLPFLVVAARDKQGRMWSTLLTNPDGEAGFVKSPTATTFSIRGRPVPGDALAESLLPGTDIGILGIEFATKRRNRVNGRLTFVKPSLHESNSESIAFRVDQSFGNCPQYIRPRRWWTVAKSNGVQDQEQDISLPRSNVSKHLSPAQIETIRSSDTIFVATGYRGQGEDSRFGNDSSHRGGSPGWIRVRDDHTILLPDYNGNNMYNTMGNLRMDNRMGITIPLFGTGAMIQLTGTATINFDEQAVKELNDPGAQRIIEFSILEVVEVPEGSLPIRWAENDTESSARKLQVSRKIKESDDVTSFHFSALQGDDPELWPYRPGQHLPIKLKISEGSDQLLPRTYSLSSGPDWGEYRISVKREPFGKASSFLHDRVQVGDVIDVSRPAGDFMLDETSDKTLVLVSSGIGVTPIISMLHAFVQSYPKNNRKAIWVHGARDGNHHPFQDEVKALSQLAGDSLHMHVAYSRPRPEDGAHDSTGRVDADLLSKLVDLKNMDLYMCGTGAFMADLQDGLEKLGVDPASIKFEQF